jgi:hypothetical protein
MIHLNPMPNEYLLVIAVVSVCFALVCLGGLIVERQRRLHETYRRRSAQQSLRQMLQRRERRYARLSRRLARSRRSVQQLALLSWIAVNEHTRVRQLALCIKSDLRQEAQSRESQAIYLEHHQRKSERFVVLTNELRVALSRERSSKAREKLWLEFLAKVAQPLG